MPSDAKRPSASERPEIQNGKLDRRTFLAGAAASSAMLAMPKWAVAASEVPVFQGDLAPIQSEVVKRHDEALRRLQTWIRQPSIAAENRGLQEGCELMMEMLREAGFQQVNKVPTDGHPGVFATLDAGAPKTLGLYFMYDVKQVDPREWSSPPFEAALVDKPGFGKVVVGRGAATDGTRPAQRKATRSSSVSWSANSQPRNQSPLP